MKCFVFVSSLCLAFIGTVLVLVLVLVLVFYSIVYVYNCDYNIHACVQCLFSFSGGILMYIHSYGMYCMLSTSFDVFDDGVCLLRKFIFSSFCLSSSFVSFFGFLSHSFCAPEGTPGTGQEGSKLLTSLWLQINILNI